MIGLERHSLSAGCAMAVVLCLAVPADAGRVVCPVCGQIFSDTTKVCPNDGTNLELLGKPVDDDDSREEGEEAKVAEGGGPPGRYKRHDRGGDRKVVSDGPTNAYSDRRKRIIEERRLPPEEDEDKKVQPLVAQHNTSTPVRESEVTAGVASNLEQETPTPLETRVDFGRRGGALTSLGVRFFWLGEGNDPGTTSGAEIELGLMRKELRLGLSSFFGVRLVRSRSDLVFVERVNVGYQYLGRFSPYIVAQAGLGAMATERFGVERVLLARSLGFELGLDAWVAGRLGVSPSLGFTRFVVEDAYWHSFTMKVSVGF